MALPQINTPDYPYPSVTLKKTINYRAFTVGEEKILATIVNSDDKEEISKNVKKVVQGCITTPDIDAGKLYTYDVELLLLKIRAKAAGEEITIKIKHPKTDETETVVINLDDVHVAVNPEHEYKMQINDDITLLMKDITFDEQLALQSNPNADETDMVFESMVGCVKGIYQKSTDKTFMVGEDTTYEEMKGFVMALSGISKKLFDFFKTMPRIEYEITFSDGEKMKLENFRNFLE